MRTSTRSRTWRLGVAPRRHHRDQHHDQLARVSAATPTRYAAAGDGRSIGCAAQSARAGRAGAPTPCPAGRSCRADLGRRDRERRRRVGAPARGRPARPDLHIADLRRAAAREPTRHRNLHRKLAAKGLKRGSIKSRVFVIFPLQQVIDGQKASSTPRQCVSNVSRQKQLVAHGKSAGNIGQRDCGPYGLHGYRR